MSELVLPLHGEGARLRDPPAGPPGGGIRSAYRAERRKLSAQIATRLLAVICVVAPPAFAAVLGAQSGTPNDTLFGAWVHQSGAALSLVVLGFCGSWGFPVIAGVLAGDVFASEDRYGTWKTILTRSRSRRELFAGKVLATMTLGAGLLGLTAASSIVSGIAFVGTHGLAGLDGVLLGGGRALLLTVASWAATLVPLLAFTALSLLASVAARSGIVGVLAPLLAALVSQLLDIVGRGVWVHMVLIGTTFDTWQGLIRGHIYVGPLLVCTAAALAWTAVCLGAAWFILRRRQFADAGARRSGWTAPARVVAVAVAVIALLALAGNWGPTGITAARVRASFTPTFERLTLVQQEWLGRSVAPGAKLNILPSCVRRGSPAEGPGDWSCTMNVFIPQAGAVPFQQTPVTYDMSVQTDGCYKAESPPAFIGGQTIQNAAGGQVVNPLFVIYGCLNPL